MRQRRRLFDWELNQYIRPIQVVLQQILPDNGSEPIFVLDSHFRRFRFQGE